MTELSPRLRLLAAIAWLTVEVVRLSGCFICGQRFDRHSLLLAGAAQYPIERWMLPVNKYGEVGQFSMR
jgi:hypothetical protein